MGSPRNNWRIGELMRVASWRGVGPTRLIANSPIHQIANCVHMAESYSPRSSARKRQPRDRATHPRASVLLDGAKGAAQLLDVDGFDELAREGGIGGRREPMIVPGERRTAGRHAI